jgi:hypothetical protein
MTVSNISVLDDMIEISCAGAVSSDGLLDLINKVKVLLSKKQEIKNILVDLTGIDGKLSFMEHFSLGEDIAKKLRGYKLAVVTKPIVVNKVAENVATKKGARMLMTYDKQKAISWLKDK